MKQHRLHIERTRFVVNETEWEVITRKSRCFKSGELAPKMSMSQQKRAELADAIWAQGENNNE